MYKQRCLTLYVRHDDSSNEPALCQSAGVTTLHELGLDVHTASETAIADAMATMTVRNTGEYHTPLRSFVSLP